MADEQGKKRLKNPQNELFCWLYAGYNNRDLFGNGTRCYIQVYFSQEIQELRDEIEEWDEYDDDGNRKPNYTVEIRRRENRIKSLEMQARTRAAELVAKRNISRRIDYLIDELISDQTMDRELAFTAAQRFDLNSKVQAIREYNRLKDRGKSGQIEGKFEFSWEGEPAKKKGTKPTGRPALKSAAVRASGVEWAS